MSEVITAIGAHGSPYLTPPLTSVVSSSRAAAQGPTQSMNSKKRKKTRKVFLSLTWSLAAASDRR